MAKATHGTGSSGGIGGIIMLFLSPLIAAYLFEMLWNQHRTGISTFLGYVRLIELWPFYALSETLNLSDLPGFSAIVRIVDEACAPASIFSGCSKDFNQVSWQELTSVSFIINTVILVFLTCLYLKWFLKSQSTHPLLKYTRTHNIKSFMTEMQQTHAHLRIFSKLDLIEKPIKDPIWGMSLTSREFAYEHRLIRGWKEDENGGYVPILDREKTRAVFTQQLGRRLQFRPRARAKQDTKKDLLGMPILSYSETMIMAIVLPLIAATDNEMSTESFSQARKVSDQVKNWCWSQFNASGKDASDTAWMHPSIDITFARSVIEKYIKHHEVQRAFRRHAYVRTAIHGFFIQARRLGVLSAAEVRWLRFYDRQFWYVIQNIGRPSCFAEGAAVSCHFRHEVLERKPIERPRLDEAVNALSFAITSFAYTAEDVHKYREQERKDREKQAQHDEKPQDQGVTQDAPDNQ
jgi:hypothetical protein